MDESQKSADRVAARHMQRTAGEVRFIKDRGGDNNEWGWNPPGSSERTIDPDYKFDARNLEPLARTLRSTLMALGHIQTARTTFTRIKSQRVSPDGNLGGKGYVMPVKDIRKQLSNCDEALSSISDTIYDEMQAPHWVAEADEMSGRDPRQRPELRNIMDDVDEIREDPEDWAEGEEAEEDKDSVGEGGEQMGKTAGWADNFDPESGRRPTRRQTHLWDMADKAECDPRRVRDLKHSFVLYCMRLMQLVEREMKGRGWEFKPLSSADARVLEDTLEAGTRNVWGVAIEVENLEWSYDRGYGTVLVSFEGDAEEEESEVGAQYDVDDIDSMAVNVMCPPEKPARMQLLRGTQWPDSPKFQATPAGVDQMFRFLDGHLKNKHTATDRVAARYLARRNG